MCRGGHAISVFLLVTGFELQKGMQMHSLVSLLQFGSFIKICAQIGETMSRSWCTADCQLGSGIYAPEQLPSAWICIGAHLVA